MIKIPKKDYELIIHHNTILSVISQLRFIDTLWCYQPETDRKVRQANVMLKEALKEIRISIDIDNGETK